MSDFSKMVSASLHKKCITYRRHGARGELFKPMYHRFEVKGGESLSMALARNIQSQNSFYKMISGRR